MLHMYSLHCRSTSWLSFRNAKTLFPWKTTDKKTKKKNNIETNEIMKQMNCWNEMDGGRKETKQEKQENLSIVYRAYCIHINKIIYFIIDSIEWIDVSDCKL